MQELLRISEQKVVKWRGSVTSNRTGEEKTIQEMKTHSPQGVTPKG